ncbi:MAG: hypothetical protein ABSG87_09545 [Verrucomicrobiota bacterium]
MKHRRDQRTFRCGFTRARRGTKWKTQSRCASVNGTAAVVPLAEPLTEACRRITRLFEMSG